MRSPRISGSVLRWKGFPTDLRVQAIDVLLEIIVQALEAIIPWENSGYCTNAVLFNLDYSVNLLVKRFSVVQSE